MATLNLNRNAKGRLTNEKCYTNLYRILSQKCEFEPKVWLVCIRWQAHPRGFEKGGFSIYNQSGISGMVSEKCYSYTKFSQKDSFESPNSIHTPFQPPTAVALSMCVP